LYQTIMSSAKPVYTIVPGQVHTWILFAISSGLLFLFGLVALASLLKHKGRGKRQRTGRIILGLTFAFCTSAGLFWMTEFFAQIAKPTAYYGLVLNVIEGIGSGLWEIFYFFNFLFIFFSWLEIAIEHERKVSMKTFHIIRNIAYVLALIWIFLNEVFVFYGSLRKNVGMTTVSLCSIMVFPFAVLICFIVLFQRMKVIMREMQNAKKGKKMFRALSIVTGVFIIVLLMHVINVAIRLGSSVVTSTQQIIDFFTFWIEELVLVGVILWFFSPLFRRINAESPGVDTETPSPTGTGPSKGSSGSSKSGTSPSTSQVGPGYSVEPGFSVDVQVSRDSSDSGLALEEVV